MLFLLTGASASGKTLATSLLEGRIRALGVHDFDELGVPSDPDATWRQQANETWLHRVLESQERGVDTMLASQTPLGELLATPSATMLDGIAACLVDCSESARARRLLERGGDAEAQHRATIADHAAWAEWLRRHARDPQWRQDVIRRPSSPPVMRWQRWVHWRRGDPRWQVDAIDTTHAPPARTVDDLAEWVHEQRRLLAANELPLSGRWWDARPGT